MSLINTTIKPFQTTGFVNGEFKDFSDADIQGIPTNAVTEGFDLTALRR